MNWLHGAPVLHQVLATELRQTVQAKAAVVQSFWIDAGRMAPVDPIHLFFHHLGRHPDLC